MKVRVFLPTDEALEPFAFGEFEFDVMPLEGHILRFVDFEGVDYPVERVGYIQVERVFIGAIWLGPPRAHTTHLSEATEPVVLSLSAVAQDIDPPVRPQPSATARA